MDAMEIIRLTAKEFDGVDDETLEKWIRLCRPMVSRKQFGKLYEQALAFLVCHRMAMCGAAANGSEASGSTSGSDAFGLSGPFHVASYSEGETSISFSTNQSTNLQPDAEYAMTSYGLAFLTLRRSMVVPILCSGEGGTNVC